MCLGFLFAGCKGDGPADPPSQPKPAVNRSPVAAAGADIAQSVMAEGVTLDGSASRDPDNDALDYEWSLSSQPANAGAVLSHPNNAIATLETLAPGDYALTLTVTDPEGLSSSDSLSVRLANDVPQVAIQSFNKNPKVGERLSLDASGSADPNGQLLSFEWVLIGKPEASGIAPSFTGSTAMLEFDAHGVYTVQLTVSDGFAVESHILDPIIVTQFSTFKTLAGFDDVEFDATNNRIVVLFDDNVSVVEPDGTTTSISLPVSGKAISVTPTGDQAAVAHDGWVSHIDLSSLALLNTFSVPADLGDIVIDERGFAHGFPATGQWVNIHTVDLTTGAVNTSTGGSVQEGTKAKLHPSGIKMYGADNGSSPSDVERYSFNADGSQVDYDSPYHGDFPFCGDLWMEGSGAVILTRCGVVVRATENRASDLTFAMQIGEAYHVNFLHADASAFDNVWYTIPESGGDGDHNITTYAITNGEELETFFLPYISNDSDLRWTAQFVFASESSSEVFVIAVDDPKNPQQFAILSRAEPDLSALNRPPVAILQKYATKRVGDAVQLHADDSYDPELSGLTFNWEILSQPDGSDIQLSGTDTQTLLFQPVIAGVYEISLRVSDGEKLSPIALATVSVFEPSDELVHRLHGAIADVEYSKSLNALVYLSATSPTLHILRLDDLSEITLPLPRTGYTVGVSPDGLRAAISHTGLASLVDLSSGALIDTQEYSEDWGDVVLDSSYVAHIVPYRDQWSELVSIDFAGDQFDTTYGPRAGTQIRMHPNKPWVYGADRGLSPSDFEKWDVSTFPSTSLGDSPYHGDYPIAGNIWISESGNQLLVAGGNAFHSKADPSVDMTYAGRLADAGARVEWADHSSEAKAWAVATAEFSDEDTRGKLAFYDDEFLNRLRIEDPAPIPGAGGASHDTSASKVFYSEDGMQLIVLLRADGLFDNIAVHINEQ
ncbi:PKD domain-containing protein [Hyphococcus sp.]|uniref:PKD domain-containing protein n=1 Tax=Hyphococcus sp. TaxID=2038636 RepID=UPI003CCBA486